MTNIIIRADDKKLEEIKRNHLNKGKLHSNQKDKVTECYFRKRII